MSNILSKIDKIDRQILSILQKNGRTTNQEIAEQANLSTAACWRRMRVLEEEGVINRYSAILDRRSLGLNFCIFVHVTLSRHKTQNVKQFEQAILKRPEVLECYATTGGEDFILKVVTADIDAYDAFLEKFLFTLPGISQVKSSITLREIKSGTELPI